MRLKLIGPVGVLVKAKQQKKRIKAVAPLLHTYRFPVITWLPNGWNAFFGWQANRNRK